MALLQHPTFEFFLQGLQVSWRDLSRLLIWWCFLGFFFFFFLPHCKYYYDVFWKFNPQKIKSVNSNRDSLNFSHSTWWIYFSYLHQRYTFSKTFFFQLKQSLYLVNRIRSMLNNFFQKCRVWEWNFKYSKKNFPLELRLLQLYES